MPKFDDAELTVSTEGGGSQPIGGQVVGQADGVLGFPLQVIRKSYDITGQHAAPVNRVFLTGDSALQPFVIVNAFLRINITGITGTSIDFSMGHDSNDQSLLIDSTRSTISDVLIGLITTGAFGKGAALQTTTDQSTYPVWQEVGTVPTSLSGAAFAIPQADDIIVRSNPNTLTALAGTITAYLLGFSL